MTITVDQIKAKLDRLIDWYGKGQHGMSERFNDGRLSGLHEVRDFIRHEEEAPDGCPDWCENPLHKSEIKDKTV